MHPKRPSVNSPNDTAHYAERNLDRIRTALNDPTTSWVIATDHPHGSTVRGTIRGIALAVALYEPDLIVFYETDFLSSNGRKSLLTVAAISKEAIPAEVIAKVLSGAIQRSEADTLRMLNAANANGIAISIGSRGSGSDVADAVEAIRLGEVSIQDAANN